MNSALPLDAYVRVSSTRGKEEDRAQSPGDQARAIRQWAELYGHELSDGPDEGAWHEINVSGGSMDRPVLNEVLRRIDAGESGGIVVYRIDRFARTLLGALEVIQRIRAAGALFASVRDNFDLSTETGRLAFNIMASFGEFERDRIATNWSTAKNNALEKGIHISPVAPFGYDREVTVDTKGRKHIGPLFAHETNAALVAELFERRAAGESSGALARWLTSTGALTPYGNEIWALSSVATVLRNEVYLGTARGRVGALRPGGERERDIGVEEAHPALTDPATWHAAQRKGRNRRAHATVAAGANHPALGVGVVRCAGCRYVMDVNSQRGGTGFNYICTQIGRTNACPMPAIATATRPNGVPTIDTVLLELVLEQIKKAPPAFEALDVDAVDVDGMEKQWSTARRKANEEAMDLGAEERMGREPHQAYVGALNRRADELLAELTEARAREAAGRVLGYDLRNLAADLAAGTIPVSDVREIVASMVQAVFVRKSKDGKKWTGRMQDPDRVEAYRRALRSRIHVVWQSDPEVFVPRPGMPRDGRPEPFDFPVR